MTRFVRYSPDYVDQVAVVGDPEIDQRIPLRFRVALRADPVFLVIPGKLYAFELL